MTESTDEVLSHGCEHCGRRFYRHRYVNRYSDYGKPVPAKFCSPACRKDAYRVRQGHSRSVPVVDDPDIQARSVPPFLPPAPSAPASLKTDQSPPDAFERLREGKVLSSWKPSPNARAEDVPDIPDFLHRA